MKSFGTKQIAASGIMAALVCVATMFFVVPIPATEGYFNIGDAMVMVAAITFGPIVGAFAGGVGAGLADALSGYSYFAPYTFFIKGIEGLLAGLIVASGRRQSSLKIVLAWVVGGLEMVTGYLVAEYFFLGYGAAAFVEVPFNFVQMSVAGLVGIPVSLALRRTRIGAA
jgi:uncharacterized membrane protein